MRLTEHRRSAGVSLLHKNATESGHRSADHGPPLLFLLLLPSPKTPSTSPPPSQPHIPRRLPPPSLPPPPAAAAPAPGNIPRPLLLPRLLRSPTRNFLLGIPAVSGISGNIHDQEPASGGAVREIRRRRRSPGDLHLLLRRLRRQRRSPGARELPARFPPRVHRSVDRRRRAYLPPVPVGAASVASAGGGEEGDRGIFS
ncbi:hypothetical protein AXF42_Ash007671 [Apostasia shenzhenica]|uniref:Uncharacterized protein n=1 Tax=Apostasia shenzhenica TaxID=1088818 RepID=A0A2I0A647_9ASPA|nr:hypothetical protein AXF42_Ash007671 [Apostasia shenzhenica]